MIRLSVLFLSAVMVSQPADATDLFGGLYVHDVRLPTDASGLERGADLLLGARGGQIAALFSAKLQPYAFGALNTAGQTSYAAAGVSLRFDLSERVFIRPGLGLAIHNGSASDYYRTDRVGFGSRVLFEPELGIGTRLKDHISVEASWVHMSHATLFSRENPGIDNLGMRLTFGL